MVPAITLLIEDVGSYCCPVGGACFRNLTTADVSSARGLCSSKTRIKKIQGSLIAQ